MNRSLRYKPDQLTVGRTLLAPLLILLALILPTRTVLMLVIALLPTLLVLLLALLILMSRLLLLTVLLVLVLFVVHEDYSLD